MLTSLASAVLVAVVAGAALYALIAQLRGGWVADHQVTMDKAGAIHNLLFRQ